MDSTNLSDMQLNQGGTVSFEDIEIKPKETFLDYLFGGCQLGLQIAIDFTISNGNIEDPGCLHYVS